MTETKQKLDEAIELLTQLRIELIDSDRPSLDQKAYMVEMKICEAYDLIDESEKKLRKAKNKAFKNKLDKAIELNEKAKRK